MLLPIQQFVAAEITPAVVRRIFVLRDKRSIDIELNGLRWIDWFIKISKIGRLYPALKEMFRGLGTLH